MTTNVLIAFYSTYGHVHRMALAVAKGAESVPDSTVRLRRIAELEEARKALSVQEAYVRAQQAQADIPAVTHVTCVGPTASPGARRPAMAT
jgi:NAD(P)H dehydrogenase (quinone)